MAATVVEDGLAMEGTEAAGDAESSPADPSFTLSSAVGIEAAAATADWRWLFLGDAQGTVTRVGLYDSLNTDHELPEGGAVGPGSPIYGGSIETSWEAGAGLGTGAEQANGAGPAAANGGVSRKRMRRAASVTALASHDEGVWVLSGHAAGSVRLWSAREQQGQCHASFSEHKDRVVGIELLRGQTAFVSGSWDGSVVHGDLHVGTATCVVAGGAGSITVVCGRGEQQAMTCNVRGKSSLWDFRAPTPRNAQTFGGTETQWILSGCWSRARPDLFYTAFRNGRVVQWDMRNEARPVATLQLPGRTGAITALCEVSGSLAVASAGSGTVRLYSTTEVWGQARVPYRVLLQKVGVTTRLLTDREGRFLFAASGTMGWYESTGERHSSLCYDLTTLLGMPQSALAELREVTLATAGATPGGQQRISGMAVDPPALPAAVRTHLDDASFEPQYRISAEEQELPILDAFTGQEKIEMPLWASREDQGPPSS